MRYINLSNNKSRDAQVVFKSTSASPKVRLVMESGEDVKTRRLIKGTSENSMKKLLSRYKNLEEIAAALIASDPEIDIELEGKIVSNTSRVYINNDEKVVYRVSKNEQVFLPDGKLKEEREPRYLDANIFNENPLKWTKKIVPRTKIFNRFVFAKNYQIVHVNGITYDFLFSIAKELADKDSMVMMAAGPKGNEPLVFNDGGKPYRAFLEGRIKNDKYCLLLHLTDLELKSISKNTK